MAEDLNPKRFPPPMPPSGMKPGGPPLLKPGAPSGLRMPPMPPGAPASGAPGMLPRQGGFPPAAAAPAAAPASDASKRLEEQNRELEETKRKMERMMAEMELKIKEEKEKSMTLVIKAREEESLSLKMEQTLKEMQEKTRIARREQELDDSRNKAEAKVKELERRLNEEREAWVINMKNQMEMRDSETVQMESQLGLRFRDLEKRWVEEKAALNNLLRQKEEELSRMKSSDVETHSQIRRIQEESSRAIEIEKKKLEMAQHAAREEWMMEKRQIMDRLDHRERELVALKAQLAMIDSQVRSAQESSNRQAQDKERAWQIQITDIQRDFQNLRQMKDQVQAQFSQVSADADSLRKQILEWEKKENQWEMREHEIKNTIAQLQNQNQQMSREREFAEKQYQKDQQDWARKAEEWHQLERSVRDMLKERENELSLLKGDRMAQEGRFRAELVAQEIKLEERLEKEKTELLAQADRHYQDEMQLKADLTQRELTSIRESMVKNLSELEEEIEDERAQAKFQLARKDAELSDALNALKDIEKELLSERMRAETQLDATKKEFEKILIETEEKTRRAFESFQEEKLKVTREIADRISLQRDSHDQEMDRLKSEFERREDVLERVESISQRAEQLTAPSQSLGTRFWNYLNGTVVEVQLKGDPRHDK